MNPTSGGKKAFKSLPKVLAILQNRNISYRLVETIYPPRREHYADVPCGPDDTVCVMGGDGTILDIMNMLPGHQMTLMYVPCGTGNDFIKAMRLPVDPVKALLLQLDSPRRFIDYAYANHEIFMNVLGTGFDVEVLRKLDMFKVKFTGLKAYMLAVKQAVKAYKPFECEISIDGGPYEKKELSVLSVGNGRFIGGGMKAVPHADPFDGMFDVVETKPVKKRMLLLLLPLFVKGLHVKYGLASTYRCKSISIRRKDMYYQIDGEIRKADTVDISICHDELLFQV